MRRHLVSLHCRQNERIPVAKVEALLQALRHGQETSGGMAQKKSKDGTTKVYQRKKQVCPLCHALTAYFTTHLQRVHRLKKESQVYKEALQKGRPYLGRRKEVKRVEKSLILIGCEKDQQKRVYKEVEPEVQEAGSSKPGKKPCHGLCKLLWMKCLMTMTVTMGTSYHQLPLFQQQQKLM